MPPSTLTAHPERLTVAVRCDDGDQRARPSVIGRGRRSRLARLREPVYTDPAMIRCGHPLCQLLGGECSLAARLSRGCRTGPRMAPPFEAELIDEVRTLLAQLAPPPPGDAEAASRQHAAATRLAFLFRREARNARNLLALADEDEVEPELRARLAALCRRRAAAADPE